MDSWRGFVFQGLIISLTFGPSCVTTFDCSTQNIYSTDSLNASVCNSEKMILSWSIHQKIYDVQVVFSCANPNGVNTTPSTLLGFMRTKSSTTLNVPSTPEAKCWFWGCYQATVNGEGFTIPSTSCIVQPVYKTTHLSIAPTATFLVSSFMSPTLQTFYSSAASQTPTSQGQSFSTWFPSPASVSSTPPPHSNITPTVENTEVLHMSSPTPVSQQAACSSWRCNLIYIAMISFASFGLVLTILTFIAVCGLVGRHHAAQKRKHDLQSLGCKCNERCDPDFAPTLTSLYAFTSVESKLDALHQIPPSLSSVKVEESELDDPYKDADYWSEYNTEAGCQLYASTSTCTFSN